MWHFLAPIGAAMPMTNPTWQSDKRLQRRECLRMHTVALHMNANEAWFQKPTLDLNSPIRREDNSTKPMAAIPPFQYLLLCTAQMTRFLIHDIIFHDRAPFSMRPAVFWLPSRFLFWPLFSLARAFWEFVHLVDLSNFFANEVTVLYRMLVHIPTPDTMGD